MLATINGTQLYYKTLSVGPPILTMHGGLGLDHTTLRPWHDELARDHRVIYYDHRGNGRSARPGTSIDHATWHADAAALLNHVEEESAIVLGHSYGAWLALGFALRYPQRVRALVLYSPFCAFDYAASMVADLKTRDPGLAAFWLRTSNAPPISDSDFEARWLKVLPFYFRGPPRADVFRAVAYSFRGFLAGAAHMGKLSLATALPSLVAPSLLLVGRHDPVTPPAQARRIAAAVSNSTVVEFANSGHLPFVEEPAAYFEAIRGWLTRTIPTPRSRR